MRETVLRYPPEEAEKVTCVPAELIREVACAYATTGKAGIYYTLGITEHTTGTDKRLRAVEPGADDRASRHPLNLNEMMKAMTAGKIRGMFLMSLHASS